MKKMKKIFAALLTLAMVLGMSMTTFAAGTTATITIENAGNGSFAAVQVIEADSTKDTGWDFVEGYDQYFTKENAFNTDDTQEIIKGMIHAQNPSATEGSPITDFDNKYAAALNNVYATITDEQATEKSPFTVEDAGVWVIKGVEEGYSYSPMAAYVGFSYESGKPSGVLDAASINAKKAPNTITKSSDDADKVVEIGKEVTYTVTGTVPFVPATDSNRYYVIIDEISGAEYNVGTGGTLTVHVDVGNGTFEDDYTVTPTDVMTDGEKTGEKFELGLTSLLGTGATANQYANQSIVITYSAKVTDLKIGNTVYAGQGEQFDKDKYGSDNDKLISGIVTLTKKNVEGEVLSDAVFNLIKTVNSTRYYAIVSGADSEYTLTGWTTEPTQASSLTTDANGQIVVNGLEKDVAYEFDEIEAPEGYSINDTNSKVSWGDIDSKLDNPVTGTSNMVDTKLSALPGTGGIGTTIFTIGGCIIMIAAAGLFFASRRKENK